MSGNPVLTALELSVRFPIARNLRSILTRAPRGYVNAVDGVSIKLVAGETLAIVGESGSGKTTIAKALLRTSDLAGAEVSGDVRIDGQRADARSRSARKELRRTLQMIYQDPYESLNPRFTVGRIVREMLDIHRIGSRSERAQQVHGALAAAHLTPTEDYAGRHPHQLSGGQRQRVAIASAIVGKPSILIADEPVSMLDVSVRSGILKLLDELRSAGVALLVITHDLSTVAGFADQIAVMYLGRIVEQGPAREVLQSPRHPYTQALISVIPRVGGESRQRFVLRGEVADATRTFVGCRFADRCPVAFDECRTHDPHLIPIAPNAQHEVACHLVERLDGSAPDITSNKGMINETKTSSTV